MASRRVETEANAGGFRVVRGEDTRTEITVSHELRDVAGKAAHELSKDGGIYQRGGTLVHVVQPTAISPGAKVVPTIRELPLPVLRVHLAQVARWVKYDGKAGGMKRIVVPDAITQAVQNLGEWESIRPLVGVLSAPTMRPDGSVLQVSGYDEATSLLLWPALAFAEVPETPSQGDALSAARAILDLVADFPFATEHDRSAWLAGVLTLAGRHSIEGPCPLFAVDANTRGSGKSRLVDVAVMLSHGSKAARSSISGVDEEMRKQITSILAEGAPAALLDNVRTGGKFGGPAFDALLTSDVWKERLLGKTSNLTLPARTVWWATGNNMRFAGDLARRALRIRLESPLENPEERSDFKYPGDELLRHVERGRRFLVTQALLILRAHAIAGRPACGGAWGSYESWSRIVASAIRWIGLPDPLLSRATEDEGADEERLHAGAVAEVLVSIGRPVTARELVLELYPTGHYDGEQRPDLFPTYGPARDALEMATNARGTPNVQHVGFFLRRVQGRIVDSLSIESELDRKFKVQRWKAVSRGAPKP